MSRFFGERQRYKPPPESASKVGNSGCSTNSTDANRTPSFPHFTSEEEELLWKELGKNPMEGWDTNGIPAFTISYLAP